MQGDILYYSSSSLNNMFGIPSCIGNLRPLSGHSKSPSITSTLKGRQNYKY